jgi:hypothetical protein
MYLYLYLYVIPWPSAAMTIICTSSPSNGLIYGSQMYLKDTLQLLLEWCHVLPKRTSCSTNSTRCALSGPHRYAILKWSSNESIYFRNGLMSSPNGPTTDFIQHLHFLHCHKQQVRYKCPNHIFTRISKYAGP